MIATGVGARMLKLSDLAEKPDFAAGPLRISPARRLVEGPAGKANVEPIVMKVFLLLLDAAGNVVTRDELFANAWGGVFVGDDSLNRAVARVRKIAAETAPGLFEIETIPRTGYRLRGEILSHIGDVRSGAESDGLARSAVSRRVVIGSAVAAAGLAVAGGFWLSSRPQPDPRVARLMDRGKEALRLDERGSERYFEQATRIDPHNAGAWGLLGYALMSDRGGAIDVTGGSAVAAERAARTALRIDGNEPNALLTMTLVQSDLLDWFASEQRYRQILAIDPHNTLVMRSLGQLLHGVGRCREALEMVERAIAIEPLTPDHQMRKAMRLWVFGRIADADRVIDRALELWPTHRLVRLGRLMIYAFTGRPQAALAMVEKEESRPILLSPGAARYWRTSLLAIENPTASAVAAAREANIEGSKTTNAIAAWAILVLSTLGELDGAFEVANGFLLGRGSVIVRPRSDAKVPQINAADWRNTYGLFTPPAKAMRLDARFGRLCDGVGLTEYWRKSGIGPDAFLMHA